MIKILGLAGSLRKGSYNRGLLREAKKLLEDESEFEIFELGKMPLFNQDLEMDPLEVVKQLKEKIENADLILFVTPEANYSIPGVLKNAIDWASRPYGDNSFDDKMAGIMGATTGGFGTLRAQIHLRQAFLFLNVTTPNRPEGFYVSDAQKKFDENGNLIDEETKLKLKKYLDALVGWALKKEK